MTYSLKQAKPVLLAIAIVFGFVAESSRAQAAERTAIVAGGCFWCVESDFEKVDGVLDVVSGYTGGTTRNPTYRQVTRGGTGHYEAVKITYDDSKIGYDDIMHLFFRSVDPTDAGGQFCDRGDSYRTAIFVADARERQLAEAAKSEAQKTLKKKVVTPILDAKPFYLAEEYHQDYYKKTEIVLTRRGPKSKAQAYKFYRTGCGRDKRVKELWGKEAPFVG